MNHSDIALLMKGLAPVIRDYVAETIRPLAEANHELRRRIESIESKGIAYRGVYQPSGEYQRGDLVTDQGSMWHANTTTRARPGESKDWTLAVKKGRDA